jgi:hypothetical protein
MKFSIYIALLLFAGCTSQHVHSLPSNSDLPIDFSQIQSWLPTNGSTTDVERIMGQHGFDCDHTNYPDGSSQILCGRGNAVVLILVTKNIPQFMYGNELRIKGGR